MIEPAADSLNRAFIPNSNAVPQWHIAFIESFNTPGIESVEPYLPNLGKTKFFASVSYPNLLLQKPVR